MTSGSSAKHSKVTIKKNVDLSQFNTLGMPAIAKTFVEISKPGQLLYLFEMGFFSEKKPFILGGGSNILFKNDLDHPVIRISIPGKNIITKESDGILVKAGAGEIWHDVVTWAVQNKLGGIENLALIPGTVGAAPIQNIGAYGVELEEVFEELELYDIKSNSFKVVKHKACDFGYRDSIFKRELKGHVIITSVTLKLQAENYSVNTTYRSLNDYLNKKERTNPGINDIFDAVVAIRKSKLPDPELLANAGSFFKNPIINEDLFRKLQKQHEEMPFYSVSSNEYKIPAGWLIEQAGWKGKKVGNVGTYKNQALVIVNYGGATGNEVCNFAKRIMQSVKVNFGIELMPEVNIVG